MIGPNRSISTSNIAAGIIFTNLLLLVVLLADDTERLERLGRIRKARATFNLIFFFACAFVCFRCIWRVKVALVVKCNTSLNQARQKVDSILALNLYPLRDIISLWPLRDLLRVFMHVIAATARSSIIRYRTATTECISRRSRRDACKLTRTRWVLSCLLLPHWARFVPPVEPCSAIDVPVFRFSVPRSRPLLERLSRAASRASVLNVSLPTPHTHGRRWWWTAAGHGTNTIRTVEGHAPSGSLERR
mmetsp:Transcript_16362/g.46983  ORF Transcript_16362/g.46983 Transcript_16362/m.46983 type:complete len:247 (-) Transcript_16362:1828-2568(-)